MEKIFNLYIYWNPSRELMPWNIPILDRPILWYGFFFALGFYLGYLVFQSLLKAFTSLTKKENLKITEALSFYVIIGSIAGARLADVLFYQNPLQIVHDPLHLFKFWEGGLSSHGGIMGILIGLWLFCARMKKKYPMLTWVAMLDLLSIPALIAGACIRIGNFFNQEILGTAASVPWAVIFGSPADGSAIVPRHPAQLYEALFYFAFFALLWALRRKNIKLTILGKTSGLFFMGTFIFRFFIEFLKAPQSALVHPDAMLDMGQLLSIPMVVLGALLFFGHEYRLRSRSVKGN